MRVNDVSHTRGSETTHFEVQASPLVGAEGAARSIDVRVLASPLRSVDTTVGVIMAMEDVVHAGAG